MRVRGSILGTRDSRYRLGIHGSTKMLSTQHSTAYAVSGKDIMVTGFGISGHGSRDNGAMGRDIAWASGGANNAQHSTVHAVLG